MKKVLLCAVILLCLAIPAFFWAIELKAGLPFAVRLYDTGRLLALLGFVLILFQYVLSLKSRWLEKGIGLDKLFGMHKKYGLIAFILIILHPSFIFLSERIQGHGTPLNIVKMIGLFTFLVLTVGVSAAILSEKLHLKYETWKRIHRLGYAVFPLGFLHSFLFGSTLQVSVLRVFWLMLLLIYMLVLLHRAWHRYHIRRHPYRVTSVTKETHDIWTLFFEGEQPRFRPGQFMIVQLFKKGKLSEPHPFTLSSSPTRPNLCVSAKSVGDFTASIRNTKKGDLAFLDGPYGIFSFLNYDSENIVFIAGGIGITPFISMLRYIWDRKLKKNIILIWGNKTEKDILFRKELDEMMGSMPSLKIVYVLSRQPDWPGENGRVDSVKIKKYVKDIKNSHIFICGPPGMMYGIEKKIRDMGVSRKQIHTERFALR